MHLCYWSIIHEVHAICMTTKLKYKKAQCHWSQYSRMLLIYACYRPMRLTVHTIIYWCMLHMLSIGNALQQWYQAMMHHCLNIDVLCMFISDKYYIRCQSITHFTLSSCSEMWLPIYFYQHFVTARARSAIGLKLTMCLFKDTVYVQYIICMFYHAFH